MTKESPMQRLRRIMVIQCIRTHDQGYHLGTVSMPMENGQKYIFTGAIETIQSTFNFNIFSANLHFENFYLEIGKESALVNFLIHLPEVNKDYLIRPELVSFNSSEKFKGKDLKKFVAKIPKVVSDLWNT
jgi:hypothetical protein